MNELSLRRPVVDICKDVQNGASRKDIFKKMSGSGFSDHLIASIIDGCSSQNAGASVEGESIEIETSGVGSMLLPEVHGVVFVEDSNPSVPVEFIS